MLAIFGLVYYNLYTEGGGYRQNRANCSPPASSHFSSSRPSPNAYGINIVSSGLIDHHVELLHFLDLCELFTIFCLVIISSLSLFIPLFLSAPHLRYRSGPFHYRNHDFISQHFLS